MNLLLLLSAFVTALTGAITGVRPVQGAATTQVSGRIAVGSVAAAAAVTAPVRMVQGWLPLATDDVVVRVSAPVPVVALFEQRRRL